jgi:hypothetical protein
LMTSAPGRQQASGLTRGPARGMVENADALKSSSLHFDFATCLTVIDCQPVCGWKLLT